MGPDRERAGRAAAFAIAFVGMVGISSVRCGGDDDDVTEANIGDKLAAAFCGATAGCCASQGAPLTAEQSMLCDLTTPALLSHDPAYVFNHDIAVACLKVAQKYD